jgi:small-conductance mechanosensitive channel
MSWSELQTWWSEPLFTLGEQSFSPLGIVKLLVFFVLLAWTSRLMRRWLSRRALPRFHVEPGAAFAIANLTSYAFVVLGVMVGLQTAGINLSSFAVILGALGVGIGFGLQTIASNFVSGLILLFERPIQVGDRIQLEQLHGQVVRIRARATEVLTNDNIAVIVPNSEFVSQRVVNWSRGGAKMRLRLPVGVAYGSDVDLVRRALLDAAASVDAVLETPAPSVRLKRFGESSLDFELLVWTSELLHRRGECESRVNFAILASLLRHGIGIPFPQREVHLRSGEGA